MKIFPKSRAGKIRFGILLLVLMVVLVRGVLIPGYWYLSYRPQEGDIVFQSLLKTKLVPKTELVRTIEGITDSCYSHCGVVVKRDGKWYVNEAIFDVHDTPLFSWIFRGRGARFAVYRLKDEYKKYIPEFISALENFRGNRMIISIKWTTIICIVRSWFIKRLSGRRMRSWESWLSSATLTGSRMKRQ